MIGISLSTLIVTVMLIGVCLVMGLWMLTLWRERRRETHRRRIAILCRICGYTYALGSKKDKSVSTCPSCGAKNERNRLTPI